MRSQVFPQSPPLASCAALLAAALSLGCGAGAPVGKSPAQPVAQAAPARDRGPAPKASPERVLAAVEVRGRRPRALSRSARLPSGRACFDRLLRRGVAFRQTDKTGIEAGITLLGRLGSVALEPTITVIACRMALALRLASRRLRRMGVRELQHWGAYAFRKTLTGAESLHASGLAIDVHAIVYRGQRIEVKHGYVRGLSDNCGRSAPAINRVTCRLRRMQLFDQLITPDDDLNHRNHLHLAIAPLDGDPR